MELVAKLSNVPYAALHVVAAELRKFGAEVVFDRERGRRGYVQHPLGKVEFLHDGDNALSLFVPVELGAIPRRLLSGGIRRMVEEAMRRTEVKL
jgi:hypothetical protein